MNNFIPLSVPNFRGNELKYVEEAIKSEWVSTGGAYINEFENKISEYVNSKGAVACQSGTAGLHTALMLCGVGIDDEVIVPTLTFIAAVNPIRYIGAIPVFMDCDDTLTIDADKLEQFCVEECFFKENKLINKRSGRIIRAIVVVHVFGNMADMLRIVEIAQKYNLKVVEDATEALGTYYTEGAFKGKHAGTIGDVGVYSFNGNKIITTGGGGMIISNDIDVLKRAKYLTTQAKDDELYYVHNEIGYNYRMTNLQAALGVAQLEQLEEFIGIKENNYNLYKYEIDKIDGLSMLGFRDDTRCNYWFYSILCDDGVYQHNKDEIISYMNKNNIQTRPIWGLINEQLPYREYEAYIIERAKYYVNNIVNVPCSTNLTDENVKTVVKFLKEYGKKE